MTETKRAGEDVHERDRDRQRQEESERERKRKMKTHREIERLIDKVMERLIYNVT